MLFSNLFLICCLQGAGQDKLGIYIKQVVKDGPAAKVSIASDLDLISAALNVI